MAKVFGDTIFGMAAEAGMRAQDYSFDMSIDEDWLPDEDGDDVAGALFNEKATFALDGFETTTGLTTALGSSIVLANMTDGDGYVTGDASGATTLVTGIKTGSKARGHKPLNVSGIWKPFIGALQV